MANSLQNLWRKCPLRMINVPLVAAFLALLLFGVLLIALYLPLPHPSMPLTTEVFDTNHNWITSFYVENRRPVSLGQVPPFLRQAFLAVEDHRFYQHHGINPGRILKAAWYDLSHRQLAQGASTITQQLAKNAFLDQKRTLWRKFRELFYTLKLELHLPKDQIFELYLNQIYFGHGAYGIKVASETYFHRDLSQLNQAEMALLAGLPKGPGYYSPYLNPTAAHLRVLEVLERMLSCNFITLREYQIYQSQPLRLAGLETATRPAPYFLDLLQAEVERIFPKEPGFIYRGGLKIESTLDPNWQELAEKSLTSGLPVLITDRLHLQQPQGALIAVDPGTGEIRALVGGTDFKKSQFNRATQALRQPGSAFKPILYAAALSHGYTLASQFDRTPQTYNLGQKRVYRPTDGDSTAKSGLLTLRDALASSSNVVAVKLLSNVGFKVVKQIAKSLGISSRLPEQLSLALGSGEVTPLELTAAYLPLVNGGYKQTPTTIRRIYDRYNHLIYQASSKSEPVLDPGVAYLVTQALTGVFHEGGTAANLSGWSERIAAGKTGTTEANRDAWFVGYTPDLLTCVFVGCDRNEVPLPGAANRIAAPIWADFTKRALAEKPYQDFTIPDDIIKTNICQETGAVATIFCPQHGEFFLTGTEPTQFCSKHRLLELEICRRSGLLPGPYCRHRIKKFFELGSEPLEICETCRPKGAFFHWLRRIFTR